MYINISKIDFGRCYSCGSGEDEAQLNGLYITPASESAISVTPNSNYYDLHGKYLKYSFDGKKWKNWNGHVNIEPEQKMYLKGEDDYVWNRLTLGKLITASGYYNVGGDISSLTNFITEVKDYTFRRLFYDDSYIKDASNLILPATTLAGSCYESMFQGCTSLTTAPELHATTLAGSCYGSMFRGCTSLTTAPELPAVTLTPYCYYYMFNGCTALTTAPELPATTLAEACYSYMFDGCASLTTAPELPATTLTTFCYGSMFNGCTSLTTAPELPATTLAENCYWHMFEGCTSLTTAPELPATKLLHNCYRGMFYGCSKLNNITMLATDISAVNCLTGWVSGVSSTGTFTKAAEMTTLPEGPDGIPAGWTVVDYGAADYSQEYMTLSALGDGEITITIPIKINQNYATSLSYSKDKSTWNETIIDNTAQTITIPVTSGENVYLKGIAKQLGSSSPCVNINSTVNIVASGNIMSLLYGDDYKDKVALPSGSKYTLSKLFNGNTHLINAKYIILPATTLTTFCYANMFQGCTSLTTAPELTATTLADSCYSNMFKRCTSLATAPELPATTLTNGCYSNMFDGCTSLTTAPELPATKLVNNCYYSMFSSCTSLTSAPSLPAVTLTPYCYFSMFSSCTSLTTAPELPAATLASNCYQYMFQGCTSLTTAPELPATTLANKCYGSMFQSCTSLTTAPELPATTLADSCYKQMFEGCSKLNYITMLATDISASRCLDGWVDGVAPTGKFTKAASMSSLPTGDSGIPVGWNVVDYGAVDYSSEYMTLSSLGDGEITITIPAEINSSYATSLSYSKDKSNWNETLIDDTEQTITIPVSNGADVYLKGVAKAWYNGDDGEGACINSSANINVSGNIMSLLYGDNFKDKTTFSNESNYVFELLFVNNTHLINAENLILPATALADSCYSGMFMRCTSLTTAPELPATTLADSCYGAMFWGCTSLTTAPELTATALADSCYSNMFYGCSKLNYITMLATDISAWSCLSNWVNGVSSTGTFTKSPKMTSLPTGESGIPSGWTVVDYGAA